MKKNTVVVRLTKHQTVSVDKDLLDFFAIRMCGQMYDTCTSKTNNQLRILLRDKMMEKLSSKDVKIEILKKIIPRAQRKIYNKIKEEGQQ